MDNDLDLRPLMDARSVAILGALPPRDHAKLASKPIRNLRHYGYIGAVYPVNPNYAEISGLRCFPSLSAIPEPVDCVMIMRRAGQVRETLREMLDLQIPAAIVCGGGFAETGQAGARAQDELAQIARAGGIAMCGPNTNGLLNFRSGSVLGFHPVLEDEERVAAGSVSVISHSGTVTGSLMARLQGTEVGFGYVVSAGNEASLQAADYMQYLVGDEQTSTVVLYLEQIRDGDRFREACQKLQGVGKSIVALKAGASEDAARVAFGHTGALVGSHTAFTAAADRYGIAVAQGLEELVALTQVAAQGRPTSRQIVGLSMSGGLSGMLADAAERAGATLAELDNATVARLREVVPISTPTNPFDLTGLAVDRPGLLSAVLDVLRRGTGADEYVFSLGQMPDATWPEWAGECSEFAKRTGARLSVYAASGRHAGDGYEFFERAGMAVYESVEPVLRALVSLDRARSADRPAALHDRHRALPEPIPLDVRGRRELLANWELPYVPYAYVSTADAAVEAAAQMGYPVAMKIASEAVAHKAKLGLIALDVASDDAARAAFGRIRTRFEALRDTTADADVPEVEIQKMLPRGGLECFLGGRIDATFGPLVSVGMGGVLVEAIGDVASALAPLTVSQSRQLLESAGALGRALSGSWDRDALAKIVSKFSAMLSELAPVLTEVECNPVLVFEKGAYIVDDLWMANPA